MYENFYQLRAKPFRLSPDPSFFFASRGHKRALAYLRYGLSQAEGFVVITGAPGTGKTTLAQILLQEMDQSDVVVAHLTTTQLEADEMLRMVMASFGLRYEGQDKAALLKTLEAFFMARSRENKRVLLVVDEAQNLPARSLEELRMLSNLQVGERALLQTFLLGQVQFRQMLDHPDLEQLRQRVIANYHLSALGDDECQSYIESRLTHVGWNNDPHFTDEAFGIIYRYTEGVPRRINMLCDRVLLFSSLEEQHTIDSDVLQEVTDELQSEISGKPIARSTERKKPMAVPVTEIPEPVSATAPPEPVFVKETKDAEPEIEEAETKEADETKTDTAYEPAAVEPTVSEPVTAEPLVAEHTEDHAAAISFPDDGGMDRAVPDDGWMQHVAQAQPDHIEIDEEHTGNNNEPAEMERFRVIAGGKEAAQNALAASRPANQHSSNVMAPLPDAPGDSQEVVLRKILRLVLAFHRSPRSFPGLDDPTQPLPNGIKAILELAIADDQVLSGLRQIAVMGISPSMLRAAVRFFVRRVLFLVGGDDSRVLGLATNSSLAEVETHYGLLMKLLRQDKKANDESGVLRVGEAYERLCRSEITSRPREPVEIFDGADDISDVEEELDLDLSPNVGLSANAGMRPAPAPAPVNGGAIITSNERTAPMARNLMLIAGAAVIVFVLYLTQIKTVEDVVPALAVDSPNEPVAATEPVTTPKIVSVEPSLAPVNKAVSEDIVPTELTKPAPTLKEDLLAEKIAAEEAAKVKAAIAVEEREKIAAAKEAKAKQEAQAKAEATLRAAAIAKLQLETEIKAQAEAQAREKERVATEARRKAETEAQAAAKIKAETAAKAKALAAAKVKADAKVKAEAKAKAAAKAEISVELFSAASLNQLLDTFSTAYQAGELNKLLGLYSNVVRTNKHIDVVGLRSEYQTSFANSSSRTMQFNNMKWKQKDGYVNGSGQYLISVTGKGKSPDYKENGDVTLQVEDHSGKLQIIRYYTSNVVVVEPVAATPAVKANSDSDVRIPTKELGALLNMLINAYSAGDIYTFMQLFAKDAQTNDQATVEGIRKDYLSLFNSTSYRSIDFKNMKWTWDKDIARGDGAYDVEVQANGQSKRNRYQGQIWIQIERRGNSARITHFAFAE